MKRYRKCVHITAEGGYTSPQPEPTKRWGLAQGTRIHKPMPSQQQKYSPFSHIGTAHGYRDNVALYQDGTLTNKFCAFQ
ncbi:hypothetical protein Alches_01550 [Alicyclobacillus hesperidum subsp. aegles]|nr:hypothetical protein Alches_01550 [Alicyclobacillus hesperidum subsp. aegles]